MSIFWWIFNEFLWNKFRWRKEWQVVSALGKTHARSYRELSPFCASAKEIRQSQRAPAFSSADSPELCRDDSAPARTLICWQNAGLTKRPKKIRIIEKKCVLCGKLQVLVIETETILHREPGNINFFEKVVSNKKNIED